MRVVRIPLRIAAVRTLVSSDPGIGFISASEKEGFSEASRSDM